jgi:hypothetical protein
MSRPSVTFFLHQFYATTIRQNSSANSAALGRCQKGFSPFLTVVFLWHLKTSGGFVNASNQIFKNFPFFSKCHASA